MNQAPTAQFCVNCGQPTINGRCMICDAAQPDTAQTAALAAYTPQPQPMLYNQSDNEGRFIDPDEQVLYQLGSGYLGTFLAGGGLTKNAAAVTNKRVYYKGKAFASLGGLGLRRCKITQIIDLKDITCVGIYKAFNLALIIVAVFILLVAWFWSWGSRDFMWGAIGTVVSLIFIIGAFVGARTLLRIDYAGGCVALDIKSFSKKECEAFRAAIYRAKDRITNYRG